MDFTPKRWTICNHVVNLYWVSLLFCNENLLLLIIFVIYFLIGNKNVNFVILLHLILVEQRLLNVVVNLLPLYIMPSYDHVLKHQMEYH